MTSHCDPAAERGVIACLFRGGNGVYADVGGLLSPTSFTIPVAAVLYRVLTRLLDDDPQARPDLATVLSKAEELGFREFADRAEHVDYLRAITNFPADLGNARKLAQRVRKLHLVRDFAGELEAAKADVAGYDPADPIAELMARVEGRVLDFGRRADEHDGLVRVGERVRGYLEALLGTARPMGIPTGFPRWDEALGGGLLPNSLDIIAARPKTGKSVCALSIAMNVARNGYPVLYVDTEMTLEEQIRRMAANASGVRERLIRDGQVAGDPALLDSLRAVYDGLERLPFYHECVAGRTMDEIVSAMRRWMLTKVGLTPESQVKPCVIFLDYFKLTSSKDLGEMAEFQAMGFLATAVKDLMAKYSGRCVAFVQLNRQLDVSQSDRLRWFCTSLSDLRWLEEEEVAQLKDREFTHALTPQDTRHGGKWRAGDFIYMKMDPGTCRLSEGPTLHEYSKAGGADEAVRF
jgi:replicative DNA helicase